MKIWRNSVNLLWLLGLGCLIPITMVLSVRWTNKMRDLQTKTLQSQLSYFQQMNQNLLNLLMSKDPMTYATLTQSLTPSQNYDHDYVPTGDEAEYKRYRDLNGLGEE